MLLGGLFIPLDQLGESFRTIAQFTPMYGLNQLVDAPLAHQGLTWSAVLNLVVWTAVFVSGAGMAVPSRHSAGVTGNSGDPEGPAG